MMTPEDARIKAFNDLRAQLEQYKKTLQGVMHRIQLRQPAGSPPPGNAIILTEWVLTTLEQRAEKAEKALADFKILQGILKETNTLR